jgi:peptidoglycan/xylan/chitin deacetylase (PgdA/CDA1 family)
MEIMKLSNKPAQIGISVLYGHRILNDIPSSPSPYSQTTITPDALDQFLDTHKDWQALSLDDLKSHSYDPLKPAFVLTFDDGYRDMLAPLIRILETHNVPAAIFICHGFCYHDLEPLEQDFASRLSIDQHGLYDQYRHVLKKGSLKKRHKKLQKLVHDHNLGTANEKTKFLSPDDIVVMDNHPLVTLGHHTHTHPLLNRLNPFNLWKELQSPYNAIAYPYGGHNTVIRFMSRLRGHKLGFTTNHRLFDPKHDSYMAIPRIELKL